MGQGITGEEHYSEDERVSVFFTEQLGFHRAEGFARPDPIEGSPRSKKRQGGGVKDPRTWRGNGGGCATLLITLNEDESNGSTWRSKGSW